MVTGETLSRGSTLDRRQGSARVPTAEVTVSRGFKRRFEAPWEENELLGAGVKTSFSVGARRHLQGPKLPAATPPEPQLRRRRRGKQHHGGWWYQPVYNPAGRMCSPQLL